jgi:hypothetical protein
LFGRAKYRTLDTTGKIFIFLRNFVYLPCPKQKFLTAKPEISLSNEVHKGTDFARLKNPLDNNYDDSS